MTRWVFADLLPGALRPWRRAFLCVADQSITQTSAPRNARRKTRVLAMFQQ
jgi:hypothetical protein